MYSVHQIISLTVYTDCTPGMVKRTCSINMIIAVRGASTILNLIAVGGNAAHHQTVTFLVGTF